MNIINLQSSIRKPEKINCSAILCLTDEEMRLTGAEDEKFYFTCEIYISSIEDCLDEHKPFPGFYETSFCNCFQEDDLIQENKEKIFFESGAYNEIINKLIGDC